VEADIRESMIPRQKPPRELPLTLEEMQIIRELDDEFAADEPKTRMGHILPEDCVVEQIDNRWDLITQTPSLPWGEYERVLVPGKHRRAIFGVFSRIANYCDLDSMALWTLRTIMCVAILGTHGFFLIIYILAAILMPKDGQR